MRRNMLSRIPVGVSAGKRQGGHWQWGIPGDVILATTATGTHGPGALYNDDLDPALRYVPALLARTAEDFLLFPDGSFDGPNPSVATYALYEQGTGRVLAGNPGFIYIPSALGVSIPIIGPDREPRRSYLFEKVYALRLTDDVIAKTWHLPRTDSEGRLVLQDVALTAVPHVFVTVETGADPDTAGAGVVTPS